MTTFVNVPALVPKLPLVPKLQLGNPCAQRFGSPPGKQGLPQVRFQAELGHEVGRASWRLARTCRLAACLLVGLSIGGFEALAAEDEAGLGPGVSLTVYNQNFAVVKERRLMRIPRGTGTIKFPQVAATIVPESVQFTSLKPGGAKVLEQNYEFDLLSADKLLAKYTDREIGVIGHDGGLIEGTLLASDSAQLILSNREGIHLLSRGTSVKDVRFASLPEGLLTRPTLVWKVRSDNEGEHLVKVDYRANAINWRVDYRAVAAEDEKTIDLSGWVTVTNNSGSTYQDARLKLMAGDLHLVAETRGGPTRGFPKGRTPGFEERGFAEYHLYTLGRPTTLANAQTKQIELVKIEDVPVVKRYTYRPKRPERSARAPQPQMAPDYGTRVAAELEFENAKATHPGLGIPLPAGPFRVYQTDADGQPEFVQRDQIDHTPKDEPVRVRIGYAADLVAECVQAGYRHKAGEKWSEEDWTITLRNHKAAAVAILVEDGLRTVQPREGPCNWEILQSSHDYEQRDFRTIEFGVDVPADGQEEISYTVRYTW